MSTFKEKFQYWWFVGSSILLAIIYFMYQRRGRTIEQLKFDAQKQLLAQQLGDIRRQSQESQEGFADAMERYSALKRRHADLLGRLGIKVDVPGAGD